MSEKNQNQIIESDTIEAWEQEIAEEYDALNESKGHKDTIGEAKQRLETLYQHTSKFIIDPAKRSKSWTDSIKDSFDKANKAIYGISKKAGKPKNVIKALQNQKDEIIQVGADNAWDELDDKKRVNKKDFVEGPVTQLFDNIGDLLSSKENFVDKIFELSDKYDSKTDWISRESQTAKKELEEWKEN